MPPRYRFSSKSRANLSECHPDLQVLFLTVIRTHDCSVIEGARSEAEQNTAVAQGRSKVRWPRSNHNVDGVKRKTAWAADVVPYPVDWSDHEAFANFASHVLLTAARLREAGVIEHAVRWGGDWDGDGDWTDERFFDGPHFELVGPEPGQ